MKKVKVVFLLLGLVLALQVSAQIEINNKSGATISVGQSQNGESVTLLSGDNKIASWISPEATSASVYLTFLREGKLFTVGTITANVVKGKITIEKSDLERKAEKPVTIKKDPPPKEPSDDLLDFSQLSYSKDDFDAAATLYLPVIDSTKHRIQFLGEPFTDLALRPNARSTDKWPVSTGLLQCNLLYDMDLEKNSTGRNYAQAVFSKIIAEGDTVIVVKESNLMFPSDSKRRLKLQSSLPWKFVISGGPFSGAALSPGGFWKEREKIGYGFLQSSIQFFDKDGNKIQANLELIITPTDRVINIGKNNISGFRILEKRKGYNVAQ